MTVFNMRPISQKNPVLVLHTAIVIERNFAVTDRSQVVMTMKLAKEQHILEKIKDCVVDGCLIYDGVIGMLTLGIGLSLVLSYSAVVLT